MFRVKSSAAQSQTKGPLNDRVAKTVQSFVNLQANALRFEAHDAMQLAIVAHKKGFKPLKVGAGASALLLHYFCGAEFAKEVLKASLPSTEVTALSLPKYFLNPEEDTTMLAPRTFYHHSELTTVAPIETLIAPKGAAAPVVATSFGDKPRYPWPRCGKTGLFFRREDVVDNLIQAAIALQFGNSFWIPSDHKDLGGFLQLKPGSDPICLPITNYVAPVDLVKMLPSQLVTPALRSVRPKTGASKTSEFNNANVPCGTNIFTGKQCMNPYLCGKGTDSSSSVATTAAMTPSVKRRVESKQSLEPSAAFCSQHPLASANGVAANNKGIWISLSQFVRHGLSVNDTLQEVFLQRVKAAGISESDAPAETAAYMEFLLELFVPVEERQLTVYNADQLLVPGRLALKPRLDPKAYLQEVFH